MPKGVWLGVDVGTVRVGVAASDPERILAFPVVTLARSENTVAELADLVRERGATQVIVGLPRTLKGEEKESAVDARAVAQQLAELSICSVRLLDERFSTTTAQSRLHASGKNTRRSRAVIDQAAAVVILENALDIDRNGMLSTVSSKVATREHND